MISETVESQLVPSGVLLEKPGQDSGEKKSRFGRVVKQKFGCCPSIFCSNKSLQGLNKCTGMNIKGQSVELEIKSSLIQGAGNGAFTKRDIKKGEIVGQFLGSPCYELSLNKTSVSIFSINDHKVQLLASDEYILWVTGVYKEIKSKGDLCELTYGINLENNLRYINCANSPKENNVVCEEVIDDGCCVEMSNIGGCRLLKRNVLMEDSVKVRLVAARDIAKGEELYYEYYTEKDDLFSNAKLTLPLPSELSPKLIECLFLSANILSPTRIGQLRGWFIHGEDEDESLLCCVKDDALRFADCSNSKVAKVVNGKNNNRIKNKRMDKVARRNRFRCRGKGLCCL